MRRRALFLILTLVAAYGLFSLYPMSQTEFVLDTRDGKSALVYSCEILASEVQTLEQAEQAHVYFQEQIVLLAQNEAAALQAAMVVASETGKQADLKAVVAGIPDRRLDLVMEVDRKFNCLPIGEKTP